MKRCVLLLALLVACTEAAPSAPDGAPSRDAAVCTFYDVTGTVTDPKVGALRCDSAPFERQRGGTFGVLQATETAPACGGVGARTGPVRWLAAAVEPHEELWVRLRRTADGVAPALRVYPSCTDDRCVASATGTATDDTVSLRWRNTGTERRDLRVAAGSAGPRVCGLMGIDYEVRREADNHTCATARAVDASGWIDDQRTELGVEAPSACAGETAPRPALWFRVNVPARTQLVTRGIAPPPWNETGVTVRMQRACGGPCVASGPRLVWNNEGDAADVFVSLANDGEVWESRARFNVTLTPLPATVRCATAERLTDDVTVRSDLELSIAPSPACLSRPSDRALFYRINVPAGSTLVASARTVTPSPPPSLAAMTACDAPTCLAVSGDVSGSSRQLRYTNSASEARDVVLAVSGPATPLASEFELTATTRTAASNGQCATPRRVVDGDALDDEPLDDARDAVRACTSTDASNAALWYAVRVGAGEQVVVSSDSSGAAAARVRLVDRCDATTCLAESHGIRPNLLGWTNDSATAREVLIALSNPEGAIVGERARLRVSVRPLPYRVTSIAAACDDMSTATPLRWGTTVLGTGTFPSQAIPFAFQWFGEDTRTWTAEPNGTIRLSRDGAYSSGLGGAVWLPSTIGPMLLPFASRFAPAANMRLRSRVVDGPRRHVSVEWTGVELAGAPDAPLTFQAWILEDGAVEFHYCNLGTSARATGSEATIGVQGGVGPLSIEYAQLRAGAVRSGSAIRFAP